VEGEYEGESGRVDKRILLRTFRRASEKIPPSFTMGARRMAVKKKGDESVKKGGGTSGRKRMSCGMVKLAPIRRKEF